MSDAFKKGLTPSKNLGSRPNSGGEETFTIANGVATNLPKGALVKVSAGVIQAADAGDTVAGVFMGGQWIDSVTGQVRQEPVVPAGTSSKGGATVEGGGRSPIGSIVSDPARLYVLLTNASVSAGVIGQFAAISGNADLDVTGKRSAGVLDVSTIGASAGAASVEIRDIIRVPDNDFEDAVTAVEVKLLNHRDTL